MAIVLYDIICSIARSFAAPGGRKKMLENSGWKWRGFEREEGRSFGRSFDRSVVQSLGRSVALSIGPCLVAFGGLSLGVLYHADRQEVLAGRRRSCNIEKNQQNDFV